MKTKISMTNVSFDFLQGSSVFLNIILNNINTCVLLLDNNMRLQAFNDALKTIFSNKEDEVLLYRKCGEAIGCAYQIEEQKECGETSKCNNCELRIAALNSYINNETIYKEHIVRTFFNNKNEKVEKHLQFSTRLFKFNKDKYILILVEDITKFAELEQKTTIN